MGMKMQLWWTVAVGAAILATERPHAEMKGLFKMSRMQSWKLLDQFAFQFLVSRKDQGSGVKWCTSLSFAHVRNLGAKQAQGRAVYAFSLSPCRLGGGVLVTSHGHKNCSLLFPLLRGFFLAIDFFFYLMYFCQSRMEIFLVSAVDEIDPYCLICLVENSWPDCSVNRAELHRGNSPISGRLELVIHPHSSRRVAPLHNL